MKSITPIVPALRVGSAIPTIFHSKRAAAGSRLAPAAAVALSLTSASAAVITGLNTDNLMISATAPNTAGITTIYDRNLPDGSARSSGRIVFDGSESDSPGLKIVNDAEPGDPPSTGDVFNAVMANSTADPNSPKQSGKRLKFQRTAHEATDLVFNHDPNGTFTTTGNDGLYKVFMAYANATDGRLASFGLSLGTGVGAGFVSSTSGDGLSFKQIFDGNDPNNSQFSALFPNGLFGGIDDAHPLMGYFSPERSGFGMAFASEDRFDSTGMFGDYQSQFGNLLSTGELPLGHFYDDDGDPETDSVLVAHQLADGTWVRNRTINPDGSVSTEAFGNDGASYGTEAELVDALIANSGIAGLGDVLGSAYIDDLAKFNLTFFIDPTTYAGNQFTLRFESTAVPEPSATLLGFLSFLALLRRRR